MIKIAICDDEQKDRDKLQELLKKYMLMSGGECNVQLFESGEEFLNSGFFPDILLLDITYDTIELGKSKFVFVPFCGEHFEWNDVKK